MLANPSWCVWTAQKQAANTFANRWRQILRNVFPDCFYAVHTHQLELANTSLPTLVCRVKAALPELRPVSFNKPSTKRDFSRNIYGSRRFSQCFPVSHTRNIVSSSLQPNIVPSSLQGQFLFSLNANYAYATRQGILTKIRACEHFWEFCEREQASNLSKGQILRALSNWMGPFDTPI